MRGRTFEKGVTAGVVDNRNIGYSGRDKEHNFFEHTRQRQIRVQRSNGSTRRTKEIGEY